jgi:hypothetical protein
VVVSLAFLFAIGTPAVGQTIPTGRLDFLTSVRLSASGSAVSISRIYS